MREKEVMDYKLLKADTSDSLEIQAHRLVQSGDLWEPQGSAIIVTEVNEDKTTKLSFYQTMFLYNKLSK